MNDVRHYTISVLQDLIKISKDEYFLLELASRKSDDTELKSLLDVYACEKKEHIIKLDEEVRRLGGYSAENKDGLEISIELYKSSFIEKNQNDLIAECLKKDDLTILKYFNAIRENIMWEVVPLIANQYLVSKSLHDQIENICIEKIGRMIQEIEIH